MRDSLKNYGITEFIFLSRITELQNSIIFIKNYGITEFYNFYQELRNYRIHFFYQELLNYRIHFFYQELRNYRILLSECGPSDGFFFNSLILDKRMCDKDFIETWEKRERDMLPDSVVGGGTLFYFYDRDASSAKLYVLIFGWEDVGDGIQVLTD